jgi:hypothetical protein
MKNIFRIRYRDKYLGNKLPYGELAMETKNFVWWLYWSPSMLKCINLNKIIFNFGRWGFDFRLFIISSQFRVKNYFHFCLE